MEKKNKNIQYKENMINSINNEYILQKDNIKDQKNNYKNKGIILIFNKILAEYNFNIKYKKFPKKEEKKEEEIKEENKNIQNEINNNKIIVEEKNKGIIKEEKLKLLEKELENSTFNDLIKSFAQNNVISSIIKDYFLFFVARNESLAGEDLENLCKILEMICEFQFEFNINKNNNLTKRDLLSLIIWTNKYYLELNEFLYCIERFNKEKIFKKKNIFQEILNKRLDKIDIEKECKRKIIGLKKGIEIILSVLNTKCIEEPECIKKIIEIIPTMYHIEEKLKLNSKEIYFLMEIQYVYLFITKSNIKNDLNMLGQILRQKLSPCRYLYRENSERYEIYNELILSLSSYIKKKIMRKIINIDIL